MDVYKISKRLLTQAEIALAARNYFEANRYARESLELVDSSDAHLVRGHVYLSLGAHERAIKEYTMGVNAPIDFYEINRIKCFEGIENLSIVY